MKRMFALLGAFFLSLPFAFAQQAEQIDTTKVDQALESWVNASKTAMTGWVDKLLPLFGAGIVVILAFIAWRLFKRTSRSSS